MEITMSQSDIKIGKDSVGNKAIVAEDLKSGIRVIIPLTDEGSKAVASALLNGIVVASNLQEIK